MFDFPSQPMVNVTIAAVDTCGCIVSKETIEGPFEKPENNDMTERSGLLISAGGNVTIGIVGVMIALVSDSQAILLDGLFNLTYFLMGIVAIKVAGLVQRGDDERFPAGYAFFLNRLSTGSKV